MYGNQVLKTRFLCDLISFLDNINVTICNHVVI